MSIRKEKKICLNMIVRNEEKIIEKSLESVVKWIDYWVIIDTGSTDNTMTIIRDFFKKHNINGELHEEPWKNFGYNRTHALKMAQKKKRFFDYILLNDADMELDVTNRDFKRKLTNDQYQVFQGGKNRAFTYTNVRLVRADLPYIYIGVTHEFITCPREGLSEAILDDVYFIDNCSGSSRSIKFERDSKLLEDDLKIDPTNVRSKFYLARTYDDWSQNCDMSRKQELCNKAIEAYRNRV